MELDNQSRRRFLKKASAGGFTLVAMVALTALAVGIAAYLKPVDESGPYHGYFDTLNKVLKSRAISHPSIILDLDRVDHNLKEIVTQLSPSVNYRIVTKSLPSIDLLKYVMAQTGSNRLMAFHAPFLEQIVREVPQARILMGKPLLVDSVHEFFNAFTEQDRMAVSDRIEWLVDTPERLQQYQALARKLRLQLSINIEIDVGLRRGGVGDKEMLAELLGLLAAHSEQTRFTGFMGYDAHVPFAPPVLSTVAQSFSETMNSYSEFVAFGKSQFPQLFERDLTFNSGGSKTYHLFDGVTAVNDGAAGSAVVKPATFHGLKTHKPALFIAAPVLKKLHGIQLPFLGILAGMMEWWNPNMATSLYLYGGGWAADIVSPPGVSLNQMAADPPNQNLLPNQSLYHVSQNSLLDIGDFVFFHPQQGDAISQFERILVMRDGKIVDVWKPFPRRY